MSPAELIPEPHPAARSVVVRSVRLALDRGRAVGGQDAIEYVTGLGDGDDWEPAYLIAARAADVCGIEWSHSPTTGDYLIPAAQFAAWASECASSARPVGEVIEADVFAREGGYTIEVRRIAGIARPATSDTYQITGAEAAAQLQACEQIETSGRVLLTPAAADWLAEYPDSIPAIPDDVHTAVAAYLVRRWSAGRQF